MTTKRIIHMTLLFVTFIIYGQQVNDSNTPLYLMQPQYKTLYGVSTPQQVKQKMGLVFHNLEQATPCVMGNKQADSIINTKEIDKMSRLHPGNFCLTSYELGDTHSAMLAAFICTILARRNSAQQTYIRL